MDTGTISALTLSTVDAIAIIGVGTYLGIEINKLKQDMEREKEEFKNMNLWVKSVIDPTKFGQVNKQLNNMENMMLECSNVINMMNQRLVNLENSIKAIIFTLNKNNITILQPIGMMTNPSPPPSSSSKPEFVGENIDDFLNEM